MRVKEWWYGTASKWPKVSLGIFTLLKLENENAGCVIRYSERNWQKHVVFMATVITVKFGFPRCHSLLCSSVWVYGRKCNPSLSYLIYDSTKVLGFFSQFSDWQWCLLNNTKLQSMQLVNIYIEIRHCLQTSSYTQYQSSVLKVFHKIYWVFRNKSEGNNKTR